MTTNREYPDLPFVPPRAWGSGRDGHQVQYLVIHHTAGSERSTSAEDGAAYDARRTDGTSTHYFVDSNSVVQCVYTWDRANAAFHYGNRKGIQYELCGTLQTRAEWLDAASNATLTNAARQAARDCRKYGIPARKIGPAQMRAGEKGICGHWDVTLAYGLGDHTDPGPHFPWDVLIARTAQFLDGTHDLTTGDDMLPDERTWLENLDYMGTALKTGSATSRHKGPDGVLRDLPLKFVENIVTVKESVARLEGRLDQVLTAIAALGSGPGGTLTREDVRAVVDEELDEQSRAGADADG